MQLAPATREARREQREDSTRPEDGTKASARTITTHHVVWRHRETSEQGLRAQETHITLFRAVVVAGCLLTDREV